MPDRLLRYALLFVLLLTVNTSADDGGWVDVLAKIDHVDDAPAGTWRHDKAGLHVEAGRGARVSLPGEVPTAYDFRVRFTRQTGSHSIAMMFPVGQGAATFEIDAWSQHLAGIQSIAGQSLQNNPTRSENHQLVNGRAYTAMVSVRHDRVSVWLDDQKIAEHLTDGSDLSVLDVWRLPSQRSLGVGAWDSAATFHSIEIRPVNEGHTTTAAKQPTAKQPLAVQPPATQPAAAPAGDSRPLDLGAPSSEVTPATAATTAAPTNAAQKRVLLVIANDGFFYREYADPREELMKVGIAVDVAAGYKRQCVPHNGSGQTGDGLVMPDLAISEADPSRYDAIVFSGGWGSSMYQFAFVGRYDNAAYNGDRQIKQHANRLINAFARDDKYIAGICHGVSVLAWSRVNGQSLVRGKRVAAPQRDGPRGIYNGQHTQPPSRWNAQENGANLTAPRSIGDPRTSVDDVAVDGKILTAEDDRAARLLGRILAQKLTAP